MKRFILWAGKGFDMPLLQSFIDAPPTAELEPITDDYTQSDEVVSAKTLSTLYKSPFRSLVWACLTKFKDMGMSYNELSMYGRLRKVDKLGPYGMVRICHPLPFSISLSCSQLGVL